MLRSRASILEAEWTSFLNKRFHTVSPVWRKRAIRIIFMNTLCALRSLFFFNLGARRLKVLLSVKTFWLERRGVCMPHVKMSLHSDRRRAAGPMQKQKLGKRGMVKQDWAPERCCGPGFMLCTWTSIWKPTCTEHSCNLNSMRADENAKCGGWLERKWPKKYT